MNHDISFKEIVKTEMKRLQKKQVYVFNSFSTNEKEHLRQLSKTMSRLYDKL